LRRRENWKESRLLIPVVKQTEREETGMRGMHEKKSTGSESVGPVQIPLQEMLAKQSQRKTNRKTSSPIRERKVPAAEGRRTRMVASWYRRKNKNQALSRTTAWELHKGGKGKILSVRLAKGFARWEG